MSGICGIVHFQGQPLDPAWLSAMVEAIRFRGPDGSAQWSEGNVGLAHLALWTTPEARRERQPLVAANGRLVLTADARLDNRADLIRRLKTQGCRLDPHPTDADLILTAYRCWGRACPRHLVGDFAFALWDAERQRLFCVRDHMGIKPFYYHWSGEMLAFASQSKAILQVPGVSRQPDEVRIADYLVANFEDKAITAYRDIRRLPPAHSLTADREGLRLETYWSLDPERELRLASDREYAQAFREIFTEAVRCRLRSDVPRGALLSGGLDSSSVACVARDLLAEKSGGALHTFSAIFDQVPECDEREFIHAVLDQGGFVPHYLHADRLSPLGEIDRFLRYQDEAFFAPNLFMHWGLFSMAREQGVRVLFDGLDGDTTVSHGIAHLTELLRTWRWLSLTREVQGLHRRLGISRWKLIRRRVFKPLLPLALLRARQARRGWRALNPTIDPAFARRVGLAERIGALQEEQSRAARTERAEHYHRITGGMIPFVLEVSDKAAAALGLEGRYPFFDKRLVEFCLALPPEQKIRQGWTRFVLRGAMDGILPPEVQWRGDKSDLSANFDRGLAADRGLVEGVVVENPEPIRPYVDVAALRQVYDRCRSRPNTADNMIVWKAVSLALWLSAQGNQTAP